MILAELLKELEKNGYLYKLIKNGFISYTSLRDIQLYEDFKNSKEKKMTATLYCAVKYGISERQAHRIISRLEAELTK